MKKFASILPICLFFSACSQPMSYEPPSKQLDVETTVARRFDPPKDGNTPQDQLASVTKIQINSPFPVWRNDILVTLNSSILNTSDGILNGRCKAHLFIYGLEDKKPYYWTSLDLAFSETADPHLISILSLPVNATKTLTIPITPLKWAEVDSTQWPEASLYQLVPTGKYLMRFELSYFDEHDQVISHVVSNFIEFTTVQNAPDVIIPEEAKP